MTDELDIEEDARTIWETWAQNHWVQKGKTPVLTLQRLEIIRTALISYGLNSCIDAIIGCKKSEWHMGSNPRGKKYNSLELILRVSTKPEEQAKNKKRIQKLATLANQKDDGDV